MMAVRNGGLESKTSSAPLIPTRLSKGQCGSVGDIHRTAIQQVTVNWSVDPKQLMAAYITPLLKKPELEPPQRKSYWPAVLNKD